MSVKLLTKRHVEFLSFKGGCTGLSESTLVKITHCLKSHVTAHLYNYSEWEERRLNTHENLSYDINITLNYHFLRKKDYFVIMYATLLWTS